MTSVRGTAPLGAVIAMQTKRALALVFTPVPQWARRWLVAPKHVAWRRQKAAAGASVEFPRDIRAGPSQTSRREFPAPKQSASTRAANFFAARVLFPFVRDASDHTVPRISPAARWPAPKSLPSLPPPAKAAARLRRQSKPETKPASPQPFRQPAARAPTFL